MELLVYFKPDEQYKNILKTIGLTDDQINNSHITFFRGHSTDICSQNE